MERKVLELKEKVTPLKIKNHGKLQQTIRQIH